MSLQLKGIINKMKQTLKMQFIYLRSFLSFFIAIDSLNFVGNVEFKNIIRDLSCSICVKKWIYIFWNQQDCLLDLLHFCRMIC